MFRIIKTATGLLGLILAGALAFSTANAQEVKLTLGHVAPAQTTYQDAAVRFADKLKELSGGKMAVNIVPGAALGGLGELWVQTRSNSLDLHLIDIGGVIAMKEARPFLVLWAPYLFKDQAHFQRFLKNDTFSEMMGNVEKETGVVYLGYAGDRPPRVVTTRDKAIVTPDDLKGQKIRTPQHPFIIQAFESWGATSTPIGAAELLISLKTGVVDGQDNGIIDFVGAGYGEVNKFFAPINYIYSGLGIWMSPGKWEQMSDQQKTWLREATKFAGDEGKKMHPGMMKESFEKAKALGVTITSPDLDAFRKAVNGMVTGMDGKAWPEGLYDKIGAM